MRNISEITQGRDLNTGTRMETMCYWGNCIIKNSSVRYTGVSLILGNELSSMTEEYFSEDFTWLIAYQTKEKINEEFK